MTTNAALLLAKQFKGALAAIWAAPPRALTYPHSPPVDLAKNPVEGFSAGLRDDADPFVWDIMIMGPADTP